MRNQCRLMGVSKKTPRAPDIWAGQASVGSMAPARVRGCAGQGFPLAAGSPARQADASRRRNGHVRRLVVDRSRCGLEVSPAPREIRCLPDREKGDSGNRPRIPQQADVGTKTRSAGRVSFHTRRSKGVSHVDIIFRGRRTSIQERFRDYATAKLGRIVKLDQKTISIDVEVTLERNPRQSAQRGARRADPVLAGSGGPRGSSR